MKKVPLDLSIDRAIEVKLKAVDQLVKELVEPLEDVGNPEQLLGKPYESWSPQELAMMISIYGKEEPNPLSNLIFRKKYEEVKQLEQEEL